MIRDDLSAFPQLTAHKINSIIYHCNAHLLVLQGNSSNSSVT